MTTYQRIFKFVQLIDFFNSSQLLRYDKQNQYRTLTGGFISIGVIITIIIGFASMIIDTFNLTSISYTQQISKKKDPSRSTIYAHPDSNFMFGVEVWRHNLSDVQRYFNVKALVYTANYGQSDTTIFPLQTCTRQHWSAMPQLQGESFNKLQVGFWLCPPIGYKIDLFGKYTSQEYQQISFQIHPCTNSFDLSRPCANSSKIDQFFNTNGGTTYFTFYFINTVINPDQPQFLNYYLQDQSFQIFGRQLGVQSYLYLTDYTIDTDYSILPYTSITTSQGLYAQELDRQRPYKVNDDTPYCSYYVAKSSLSSYINRQVQKISAVFSFIGGLIGALMAGLFIINSYTHFSLQVSIAASIFQKKVTSQKKNQVEQQQLKIKPTNFLHFIKYNVFLFLKYLKRTPNWPYQSYLYECSKQINHQLDIKNIVKRLIFLEYALSHLFQDYQIVGLIIHRPHTPQQIKLIRTKFQSFQDQLDQSQLQENQNNTAQQKSAIQLMQSSPKINICQAIKKQQNLQNAFKQPKHDILIVQNISSGQVSSKRLSARGLSRQLTRKKNDGLALLKQSSQRGNLISKKILESLEKVQKQQNISLLQIPIQFTKIKTNNT